MKWPSLAFSFVLTATAVGQNVDESLAHAADLERKGDTREALTAYLAADKQQPDHPEIIVKIAKQYGDLMPGEPDAAARKRLGEQSLGWSQRALEVAPNDSDSHLAVAISLGKLVEFQGNRQKVEMSREIKSHADRALQLDPKSDYAHHLLGRWNQEIAGMGGPTRMIAKLVYGELPAGSYEAALEHFRKARELRPDRLIHQIEYGRTLAMMGRKEQAQAEIQKGLAMPNRDKDDEEAKQRGRAKLKDL